MELNVTVMYRFTAIELDTIVVELVLQFFGESAITPNVSAFARWTEFTVCVGEVCEDFAME
jgi:hypothetical protein